MQFPTHLTAKRFMTDSGPVLTSYFGGRDLPGSSTEHGCHMLSAFLTWYNIPHPKALRQMGLQGLHSEPLIYSLSNIYLKEKREIFRFRYCLSIEREPIPDGRPQCSRGTQFTGRNKFRCSVIVYYVHVLLIMWWYHECVYVLCISWCVRVCVCARQLV